MYIVGPLKELISDREPPNPQQYWSFYSTQFIILVYIIMSDRDTNKQPEKLELQSRQIAMMLYK